MDGPGSLVAFPPPCRQHLRYVTQAHPCLQDDEDDEDEGEADAGPLGHGAQGGAGQGWRGGQRSCEGAHMWHAHLDRQLPLLLHFRWAQLLQPGLGSAMHGAVAALNRRQWSA